MDQAGKRRGRPVPDAINMKPIAFNLEEALAVETTYRPNLLVIQQDLKPWEVSLHSRDCAVQILRFLRIWFDVPHTVFFSAVTYLDLFLSRIKVQEKYLNCLTISCFYIAALKDDANIDINRLVTLSQSKCSVHDMRRMIGIVKEKLKIDNNSRTTTGADFLLIYLDVLECVCTRWDTTLISTKVLNKEELLIRLEVLLSDSSCAFFRSSTLSLVLLKLEIEKFMAQAIANKSVYLVSELVQLLAVIWEIQPMCKVKPTELLNCSNNASRVLQQYDNQNRTKHRQNLIWRFSLSTRIKGSKCKFQLPLDTIDEKFQRFHKKRCLNNLRNN